MPVRNKLDEIKFLLNKLETSDRSSEDFQHYLSAFLGAAASVPDWLLYDYATKYLELSLEDYIDDSGFELAAKAKKDERAKEFIK